MHDSCSTGLEVVALRDTLARLMVQTARQAGLANVYRNILNFDGSEFYIKYFPEAVGLKSSEVQSKIKGGTLIGLRSQVNGVSKVKVNPGADLKVQDNDDLIVLAEDDSTFSFDTAGADEVPSLELSQISFAPVASKERILICGYRSDLHRLISYLDAYLKVGSEIHLMPGKPFDSIEVQHSLMNASLKHLQRDPAKLQDVREAFAEGYQSILLVADDTAEVSETDARTVITLLMLRDAMSQNPSFHPPRIISEILDPRTKELITGDKSTDFVVSSELTSMLLAQVSEQKDLNQFYQELFDPDGSEIYLKSAERYVKIGEKVTWGQVQSIARAFKEIPIGCYRSGAEPFLNPDRSAVLTFLSGDKIVMLAEDDRETIDYPLKSAS